MGGIRDDALKRVTQAYFVSPSSRRGRRSMHVACFHIQDLVLRLIQGNQAIEKRAVGGGDQALPDSVRLEQVEESFRAASVEGVEDVVEEQQRHLLEAVVQVEELRQLERHPEGAVLSLRGIA